MMNKNRRHMGKSLIGPDKAPLPPDECPLSQILGLIGHRWAVQVLWTLHHADQPVRFRQLLRKLNPVTQKELTNRLRELEAARMVHRRVYAEVPPRVEYRMTKRGRSIMPLFFGLAKWVKQYGLELSELKREAEAKRSKQKSKGAPASGKIGLHQLLAG